MPRSASIDVRAAHKVLDAAARDGVPVSGLCRAVGIDCAVLQAADERMPFNRLVALYEHAARLTGDDDFGLHLAQQSGPENYDLLGYLVLNGETLGDAFRSLIRYVAIWTDAVSFSLQLTGREVRLTYVYRAPAIAPAERRHEAEHMLATMMHAARVMTATNCRPLVVRFEHRKPKSVAEHKRIFDAPLRFGVERTELVLPSSMLDLPLLNADPALGGLLERHASRLLENVPQDGTLADEVRRVLSEASRPDELRLSAVARRLKTGSRTLQRRLDVEGASFQQLLREVRRTRAQNYLRNPKLAICEVAYLLGFSQPSAFHRAFHQWTGMTPRTFRTSASPRARDPRATAQ